MPHLGKFYTIVIIAGSIAAGSRVADKVHIQQLDPNLFKSTYLIHLYFRL